MAGYSKGIVDTRKLNKNSKAKLGRGGDTKIREVDNKESHVSALEAYLIDVNGKAGEEYAKRVGAGTINPFTGMPEYHVQQPFQADYDPDHNKSHSARGDFETHYGGPGQLDYATVTDEDFDLQAYAGDQFGITEDQMKYIGGFEDRPFDFLETAQTLAQTGATTTRDIGQREAGDLRSDTLAQLRGTYEDVTGQLGSQQTALGRTAGRGIRQASGARASAASRSGLATSGTITQAYETQRKDILQDYGAGMGDISRKRKSAQRDLTFGTGIAQRDYTQTMGDVTSAYDLASQGATLDYESGVYSEQQRQIDELYADITAVGSVS